ncbi:MAG: hypothetical protein WCY21_07790 [Candidatus Cloacimonadaceae bacterium]|nr:hypothetical protein [Candidatus Cloacimonadota bacterium]MDX9950362.1 hypothetical protein [Candidatus Syntrophosphaera sp.]
MKIRSQTAKALGLQEIFDLIGIDGDYPAEVKKRELQLPPRSLNDLKSHFERLREMIDCLRGQENSLRELKELFAHIPKLEIPKKRGGHSFALHELFLFKQWLYHYGKLHAWLRGKAWLDKFILPDLAQAFKLLDPEGGGLPSFHLSPAYSKKLGEILSGQFQLANRLKHSRAEFLAAAREELDLPQLKEALTISRAETVLANRILQSPFFVLSSESVANYSFILADDEASLELKKELALLQEKREAEEAQVLKQLSINLGENLPLMYEAQQLLNMYCWLFILSDFALRYDCAIPKLSRKRVLRVKGAANLPLKLHLESLGRRWQSLDYDFNKPVSLLTGPNMGGKTTVLKTAGQLCWLARLGIPLACAEAEIPFFDHIWYNQSESGSEADLSSFGREVVAFSETLNLDGNTLFLLDEFARGTNPTEGERLASAVLKHLCESRHMCLASTHFTAPALLNTVAHYSIAGLDPDILDRTKPLSPSQRLKVLNDAMNYELRRLKTNQAPPLSAIRVARALGMPEEILKLTQTEE